MKDTNGKRGVGRPRKIVDETRIIDLASKGHTLEDVGALCGVSVDTLERNFADAIKKGHALRNGQLRAKQYEIAMKGNVTMLIWLGKVLLGQREQTESADSHPSPFVFVPRANDASASGR